MGSPSTVLVARWNGKGWSQLGGALNSNPTLSAFYPALALDGSDNPVVAWTEAAQSTYNAFVSRWNGASWTAVGGAVNGSTGGSLSEVSLSLDLNGLPWVAWSETNGQIPKTLHVSRWSAGWSVVGAAINNDPNGSVAASSLIIDRNGNPYVAWAESPASGPAMVYAKRWSGTGWSQLGSALNVGALRFAAAPSLAIDSHGRPAVAWTELRSSFYYDLFVRFWSGTWSEAGAPLNGSVGCALAPSIAFDDNDNLFTAWDQAASNLGDSGTISVKRQNK
jgi:hypothetical protein